MAKIYIDRTASDSKKASAVSGADDTDLRVFAAMALSADEDGCCDTSILPDFLGLDIAEITASVKFWKGAGIVKSQPARAVSSDNAVPAAHKGGVISHTSVEEYSNDELVGILETGIRPAFVDEAQKAMGKMFNKNEVGKLIGIVDQLGFEEEAVLAILSYCVRLDRKSISYAEKIAITFHDQDISTAAEVHAQIDYLERRNSNIEKIRNLYGFGGRALTTAEKKYFTTWTEEYGFDFDVIKKAYEITVDTILNPAPRYTAKILSKWHDNGLRNMEEIETFIAAEKSRQPVSPRTSAPRLAQKVKDSEADDWFEQRLKQKFGD